MIDAGTARGAFTVWRILMRAQLREQPIRSLLTVLAIALGVALGAAVYLVNAVALNEFGLATMRLAGEADIVVRGPPQGFAENVYADLARRTGIEIASPLLELQVALPGRGETLKVLGLDPFRAAALQPALMGDMAAGIFDLLRPESIYLSHAAARELHLDRGDSLQVMVGSLPKTLKVLGVFARSTYPQPLGVMDIASAQWTFERVGRLNRIDLRLRPGTEVESLRNALEGTLPAGVRALAPQVQLDRAVTVTRAYRVNLNMLALVALWSGAFLVFSTQSLSVLRRRGSLALLRALGVTRAELQLSLIGEGAALGAAGSLIGVLLACGFAAVSPFAAPWVLLGFFAIGTLVACVGAWLPARAAATQAPAQSLKGSDLNYTVLARGSAYLGLALLGAGAVLSRLPAIGGLPLFGYAAIAALLFGGVMGVPAATVNILRIAPRTYQVVFDTAVAQLKENVGLSTLSLASIIVSFSLMVAMAIMVHSFRASFDQWLGKLLPADLQLRVPTGNDTAYWSPADQAKLAAVPGLSRIEFRRTRQVLLDAEHPPVTLIARGAGAAQVVADLPLLHRAPLPLPMNAEPTWISETLQELYGYGLGDSIALPLADHNRRYTVAGIWRDYAHASGAVVISRPAYIEATGDGGATEASVWLESKDGTRATVAALRACFARADSLEILTGPALRERSLQLFDRAFAITYALEAVAVIIGLTGVGFAASSTALARRGEFGMLRHIGMRRSQIIGLLASEGVILSLLGVAYGLSLGVVLSLVLVFVINHQSFNWSIDLAVPFWQLGLLSITLVAAAALTAIWGGRAAMSQDAVRAVREDW